MNWRHPQQIPHGFDDRVATGVGFVDQPLAVGLCVSPILLPSALPAGPVLGRYVSLLAAPAEVADARLLEQGIDGAAPNMQPLDDVPFGYAGLAVQVGNLGRFGRGRAVEVARQGQTVFGVGFIQSGRYGLPADGVSAGQLVKRLPRLVFPQQGLPFATFGFGLVPAVGYPGVWYGSDPG